MNTSEMVSPAEARSLTIEKNNEQLLTLMKGAKLEEETITALSHKFNAFNESLYEWENEASLLIVENELEVDKMDFAKKAVKTLKQTLGEVEKTRKELKEESLRKGQAIDAIGRWFKGKIEPLVDHYTKQADFVKIQEQKRLDARLIDRNRLVEPYSDVNMYMNLRDMSDEAFDKVLEELKMLKQAKIDREAQARKDAEELEKLRVQNEALEKEKRELAAKNEQLQQQATATPTATGYTAPAEIKSEFPWDNNDLLHDKEMMKQVVQKLKDFPLPVMKTDKYKRIAGNISILLGKIVAHIEEKESAQ